MTPIICLDAGHYGKYNRAPGVPEYYESEVMWRLHLKQVAALKAYGFGVITTREDPAKDRDLFQRGYAAKGCGLFLSNHSNAAERESADYVRAYHLCDDTGTDVDDISKELAALLAATVAGIMPVQEGWQITERKAKTDKNGDGMINDNYYGVLNGARQAGVPGIILEHSFHTNPEIAKWLLEDANLDKMAQAEAAVIAKYFGLEKPAQEPEKPAHDFTLGFRALRRGDRGGDVAALQRLLMANGYDCGPKGADGEFGKRTDAALTAYQADHGLGIDGVAGPKTMGKLLGVVT